MSLPNECRARLESGYASADARASLADETSTVGLNRVVFRDSQTGQAYLPVNPIFRLHLLDTTKILRQRIRPIHQRPRTPARLRREQEPYVAS